MNQKKAKALRRVLRNAVTAHEPRVLGPGQVDPKDVPKEVAYNLERGSIVLDAGSVRGIYHNLKKVANRG